MCTMIPENMKKLMRNLGYTLSLDREGGFYITCNEYPYYQQVQRSDSGLTVTTGVKTLSFNTQERKLNDYSYLALANLSLVDNASNNTNIRVDDEHSNTKIKVLKNYDGYEFRLDVTLLKNGTIEIEPSENDAFSCLKGMTINKSALEIIKYLNEVDIRLMPLIEYFSSYNPNLSRTVYNLQEESQKQSKYAA